ncbi:MAG: winged helix-turn-helix domain-containing protein [Rhizomicrobium sp.]
MEIGENRRAVLELASKDPGLSASGIARRLGISPQRVAQIAKKENLSLPKRTRDPELPYRPGGPPMGVTPKSTPRTAILTEGPCSTYVAAAVSELMVASDLLARGWHPFLPIVKNSHVDLMATDRNGERPITVEVRSGKRIGGRMVYQKKTDSRAHHIAVVVMNEPTRYEPDLPDAKVLDAADAALWHPPPA